MRDALSQVWLFIVAPLLGGALAAIAYWSLFPPETEILEVDVIVS